MAQHPDLAAEQAYIDHAYACLESSRQAATRLTSMVEVGRGGTEQARFERDVICDTVVSRLTQLQLGDAALCFGRIDRAAESPDGVTESFYIGRIAVADSDQEPVIVDWRAPVAEPFYRATGRQPMGLARRRHFATRGRSCSASRTSCSATPSTAWACRGQDGEPQVSGQGALIAALETARTGRLGDIVATIQGEQDEIIRAPLPGVLVVQGGPGTGKTVVALHRAAYLLYTHRFPLEGQGVLVVGPNRLFLGYIEQVLPSLGEAGVELAVLADLVPDARASGATTEASPPGSRATPGWSAFLARAVRDRQRALRTDLVVGYGLQRLTLTRERSSRIVAEARRRYRRHNAGPPVRRERAVRRAGSAPVAASSPPPRSASGSAAIRRCARPSSGCGRCSPRPSSSTTSSAARRLLRHAGRDLLDDDEWLSLYRLACRLARRGRPGPTTTCRCSTRRRSLLGPKPKAPSPRGAARRRRDPHLRPHRGRRGPGPLADAAAHARAPLAQRLDDRGRRHRPGHRASGPTATGTRSSTCCRRSARPAAPSSPSATASGPDHGPRRPGAAPRRARPPAAPLGPRGRRRAPHRGAPRRARLAAEVVVVVQAERARRSSPARWP